MGTPRATTAILIDLDGTLMDTVPDLAAAANEMRRDFGLALLPRERIAAFVGKGADVLIHRALTDELEGQVDAPTLARGRTCFYAHYHRLNGAETVLFEGVPGALRRLREAGMSLACVTNKPREFTVPLLERLDLSRWFHAVIAGDDVVHPKPHPELLLVACTQLGVAPEAALMLGDSVNDVLAARAAGMATILVTTGYNEGVPVESLRGEAGVEAICPSLEQAAEYILARRGR